MGYIKDKIRAAKGKDQKKARANARPRARESEQTPQKRVSAKIASLIDAMQGDDLERVVRVWREAMGANSERWDGETKEWICIPDHRTRIEATKIFMAYKEGLPVQRQIILTSKFEDLNAMHDKLRNSPEAMRILASMGKTLPPAQETGSEKAADVTREETVQE